MRQLLFKQFQINVTRYSNYLKHPLNPIVNTISLSTSSLRFYSDATSSTLPKSSIPLPESAILRISDKCIERILYTQKRDKNENQALRVVIESGGCHGFKISFDITDQFTKDDVIFEKNGAKVVTNKAFLPLVGGSEVDFETELIGSTFRLFNNPNAASGCGCGISFELK